MSYWNIGTYVDVSIFISFVERLYTTFEDLIKKGALKRLCYTIQKGFFFFLNLCDERNKK